MQDVIQTEKEDTMDCWEDSARSGPTRTPNELVGENLEEEQLLEAFVGVLHTTTKMKKSLVALQRNKKKEEGRQYEVVPWFVGLVVRCNKTGKDWKTSC